MNLVRYVVLMFLMLTLASVIVSAQAQLEVQWATYLGGSGKDQMRDLCVDRDDNVYVCGVFTSTDFPKPRNVPTSFDTIGPGGYLASFSPTGEMRWLQYFSCVRPLELAISDAGVLVMVGSIANQCGNVDATVSTFTTLGERFARDQFLGGSEADVATSVDIVGNTIYVGGVTESRDFPTTANAMQASYQGGGLAGQGIGDGFVAKLSLVQSASGWQIVPDVVTYFGGRYLDEVLVVRAKYGLGSVYVGGRTRSDKLPGSIYIQDRLGTTFDDDGFIAKLDASSLVCQWSMFCGGIGNEVVHGLQPVPVTEFPSGTQSMKLRVCGTYNGSYFPFPGQPSTPAPYLGGSLFGGDAFYFEIDERFGVMSLLRNISTSVDDIATALPRDAGGLTGPLLFSNGTIEQSIPSVGFDAYLWNATIPTNATTKVSVFQGNADEITLESEQIRFGFGGNDTGPNSSYICGTTTSTAMPGTNAPGPVFQRISGGDRDGVLVKIGCGASTTKILASDSVLCASGDSVTLTLQPTPANVVWGDGNAASTRVVTAAGTYRVKYAVGGCEFTDSVVIRTGVLPSVKLTPADTVVICDTSSVLLAITGSNIERVGWSTGEVTRDTTLRVRTPGRYSAIVYSPDGCSVTTDTVTVVNAGSGAGNRLVLKIGNKDSVRVGDTLRLVLRWDVPPGTALESLPLDWSARLRFDRYLFFPVRPLSRGVTDDSLRTIVVSGRRKITSDTLGIVLLHVALGETDTTGITVDSLLFDPCGGLSQERSIGVRIAGVCEAGGSKRFVTSQSSRPLVTVASNPVGTDGAVAVAEGEGMSEASGRIINVIGQEVPVEVLARTSESAEWAIPSWLPTGRYVFVVQSPTGLTSTIFEVVR